MKVYVPIILKKDNKTYKPTIQFVNPNASKDEILAFISKLNSLSDNSLYSVLRVVEDFCNRSESAISLDDILSILDNTYIIKPLDDGIKEKNILDILNNSYEIQPVSGGITQSDIDSLFSRR